MGTPDNISISLQQAQQLFDESGRLVKEGRFAEAEGKCAAAVRFANEAKDQLLEARALQGLGYIRLRRFSYRESLAASFQARKLAEQIGKPAIAGAVSINISAVYSQFNDLNLASREIERAIRDLKKGGRVVDLAWAFLNYADLKEHQDLAAAIPLYQQALSYAWQTADISVEARVRDHFGETLLKAGRFSEAENYLLEAFRLRFLSHDRLLYITKGNLALLEYEKGNYELALRFISDSLATAKRFNADLPRYRMEHLRGKILWALGKRGEALTGLRETVRLVKVWRRASPPADSTDTSGVAYVHEVYADFAEAAAQVGLAQKNQRLIQEALEALAENRAASLRDQLTSSFRKRGKLPPEYFSLLAKLQHLQSLANGQGQSKRQELEEVRYQLAEIENRIGLEDIQNETPREKIHPQKTLKDIQHKLRRSEALLSFHLGKRQSLRWAVTRDRIFLHVLPPGGEIEQAVRRFRLAIQSGDHIRQAEARSYLSQTLMGHLPSGVRQKSSWLLVADGALHRLPFAALASPGAASGASDDPLIAHHDLRNIPSEFFLAMPQESASTAGFVGVGDPVYNRADSRAFSEKEQAAFFSVEADSFSLARLPGSEFEVRGVAQASGWQRQTILLGPDATPARLEAALKTTPAVIHFAVHVVSPENHPEEAALALSLSDRKIPTLLTPERIATFRIPGSLVVLSGCSSQRGQELPSAGLIGLSRAWLLAGASAVVVSAWPTPDDSGKFFQTLYTHFRGQPRSGTISQQVSRALRNTQLQMERNGGYRSRPGFWAAFSLVSKN